MMSRRTSANSDASLWQRETRDVKPLAPRPRLGPQPLSQQRLPVPRAVSRGDTAPHAIALDRFSGIDRANATRLKRGQHRIDARLDLHGMTQDEAHRVLLGFIRAARAGGKRCVLVITGRGRLGGGVLKAAVPRWLDEAELRPHLQAIATAQPRDGGAGALYIMLRRNASISDR
ncbi:MAG TPA: Smr/MutS family protein [Stellaceae bacterium]|nr:Smr/MutS family protein [Stellaceae bacterium]